MLYREIDQPAKAQNAAKTYGPNQKYVVQDLGQNEIRRTVKRIVIDGLIATLGKKAFRGRVDGREEDHDPEKGCPNIGPDGSPKAEESDEDHTQNIEQNTRQGRLLTEFEPEFFA